MGNHGPWDDSEEKKDQKALIGQILCPPPWLDRMEPLLPSLREVPVQSSLLEIVELPNGDIVLRRVGDDSEDLMRIHFTARAREYMPEGRLEVARVMIHAGIQAAAELSGGQAELDYVSDEDTQDYHTIH